MLIDCKSDYSLLGSLMTPEALVENAKKSGWQYIGILDTNAGGLLDTYLCCKDAGVKPILGLSFQITDNLEAPTDGRIFLYAQNNNGYHNLIKVSSKVNLEGNGNLLIDWLNELGGDLVCVMPIGNSPNELYSEQGKNITKKLMEIFKGKIFRGLYNRDCAIDDIWLEKLKEKELPYLFLSGAKYFKSEDVSAFKVLRAINEKTIVGKVYETIWLDESIEKSLERLQKYEHTDYLNKFLELFNLDIPTPGLKVPKFAVPEEYKTSYDYFLDLCRKGYKAKSGEFPDKEAVKSRMETELKIIKECELADYFLLVFGICQYCDTHEIPRGIGRGSVGGCLVAYFLDIHKVNPLEYGLLFERFLNPDRTRPTYHNGELYLTDCADVDLDIGQMQRQEVIDWIRQKYGFVAKISTYTTLSAKNCIRETIRTFGRPEYEAAYVSGFVESMFGKADTLQKTYDKHEKFRAWVDKNQYIYQIALKLEGLKKNSSIHAAGILISDSSIENKAPLTLLNTTGTEFKEDVCCGYDLDLASKASLLKVDVLGIRTLNLLQDTVNLIKEFKLESRIKIDGAVEPNAEQTKSKEVWGTFIKQYS